MSNKTKKLEMFKIYVKALKAISIEQIEFAICPLCLKRYSDLNLFSLEHTPPKSQGGKDILITCIDCNNIAGYALDSHLSRREFSKNFYASLKEPRSVLLNIVGLDLNSTIKHIKDEEFTIKISAKNNSPIALQKFEKAANGYNDKDNWSECKFRVNPQKIKYTPFRAAVSCLKSAYLIAFAQFGYRYILRDSLDIVREQIQNNEIRLIDRFCADAVNVINSNNAIIVLNKPFEALIVQFKNQLVFLPFLDSVENFYSFLSEYSDTVFGITGTSYPFPDKPKLIFDFVSVANA